MPDQPGKAQIEGAVGKKMQIRRLPVRRPGIWSHDDALDQGQFLVDPLQTFFHPPIFGQVPHSPPVDHRSSDSRRSAA
ncbi:MAG: hypothetical protein ACK5LJ_01000 [Paracoccus sp. (in: a-proteobacteria)]